MKSNVYYYEDELNDEFSGIVRNEIQIGEEFKFVHTNIIWRFIAFIVYYIFVFPYAWLYLKIKFHHKVVGKNKLKLVKNHQYFVYGNHTQVPGDGFLPASCHFPIKPYVVVSKENLALKGTRNLMQMLGAIPIPTSSRAIVKFNDAMKYHLDRKHPIVIYPEAHIWPYYTKIRPFKSVSFRYPVKMNLPVYSFTNVYTQKWGKTPKMTTYIDGPFYPDDNLKEKDRIQDLRNKVYDTMVERSKLSNYSVHTYIKKNN